MKSPHLALCLLLLVGCAAPKPLNLPPIPTTRSGLTLEQLRTRSLMLEVGMSEAQVVKTIGLPTSTSIEPFGQNTATPWNGFAWKYQVGLSDLRVVFQPGLESTPWTLNNWNWLE